MLDATEENDFKGTIEVFLKGAEVVVEAEDLSNREGVYFGRISKSSIIEIHLKKSIQQVKSLGTVQVNTSSMSQVLHSSRMTIDLAPNESRILCQDCGSIYLEGHKSHLNK